MVICVHTWGVCVCVCVCPSSGSASSTDLGHIWVELDDLDPSTAEADCQVLAIGREGSTPSGVSLKGGKKGVEKVRAV